MLKKIDLGYAALILGLSLTLVTSAFKSTEKSKFSRTWYFQSNNVTEAADETKYSYLLPPPTSCDSGTALPCSLVTPDDVDTPEELEAYIDENYHGNYTEVMAAPIEKRAQL